MPIRRPRRRKVRTDRSHYRPRLEVLEARRVLSSLTMLPPPDPIIPGRGESQRLAQAEKHERKENDNALENFPVPMVVVVEGPAGQITKHWKANSPIQLDVDQSKSTGKGGKDLILELDTIRPDTPDGQWQLNLTLERIRGTGGRNQLPDGFGVAVVFPFSAFNEESLPGAPNVYMGYELADGDTTPKRVELKLEPHQLGGTRHDLQWKIHTIGATSPVTFLAGHFDGDHQTGPLNGSLLTAAVAQVPEHLQMDLQVGESGLQAGSTESSFDLQWSANAATPLELNYWEGETPAAIASSAAADFHTRLVVDTMPAVAHVRAELDEAQGKLDLLNNSVVAVGDLQLAKSRSDGLSIAAQANDVPAHLDLALGLDGVVALDVSSPGLDLNLQAHQTDRFEGTAGFFRDDHGYIQLQFEDAPTLSGGFDAAARRFDLEVPDGSPVALFELLLDDDAQVGVPGPSSDLDLPPAYAASGHVFSIVDEYERQTAVGRLVHARSAAIDHDAPPLRELIQLATDQPVPMQVYLRTGAASTVIPAPTTADPDAPYVELTCNIQDVPAGSSTIELLPPLSWSMQTETPVDSIGCTGTLGTLSYGLTTSELPTNTHFDFRPEGSIDLQVLDGAGTPDDDTDDTPASIGFLQAHLFDPNGFDPALLPLPESSGETFFPTDTRLKDAKLRIDHAVSFLGTWDDQPETTRIQFDTAVDASSDPGNSLAYLGGLQLSVSTTLPPAPAIDLDAFVPASDQLAHYARMTDTSDGQTLEAGVFGLDRFEFAADNAAGKAGTLELDWNLRPDRPFTPFQLDLEALPAEANGLGTYFGAHQVTGSLGLSYLPSRLHLESDLDPEICTNGLFGVNLPPGLVPPIPSEIDLDLSVDDNVLLVHAEDLPPVFCLTFEASDSEGVLSVLAEEEDGAPAEAGLVEVLFQNDFGLPDDTAIVEDAENPLRELRIRLDDAPSLNGNWRMQSDAPRFVLGTVAEAEQPFSVLGGLRLTTSHEVGTQDLPVFPPLNGSEPHSFRFIDLPETDDELARKELSVGIFGVDEVGAFVQNQIELVDISYMGDADRQAELYISSVDGIFFPDKTAEVAVAVNDLPRQVQMRFGLTGDVFILDGNSGIDGIAVGGPALLGLEGEEAASFDTIRSRFLMSGLPAKVHYSGNFGERIQFDVESCSTVFGNCTPQPDSIDRAQLETWVESEDGDEGEGNEDEEVSLDTETPLFSEPLKQIRLQLDDIPSMKGLFGNLLAVPTKNESGVGLEEGDVVVNFDNGSSAEVFDRGNATKPLVLTSIRGEEFAAGHTIAEARPFPFRSQQRLFTPGQTLVGGESGASARIARVDQVGGRGTLYLTHINGLFRDDEPIGVDGNLYAFADGDAPFGSSWQADIDEGVAASGMRANVAVSDPDSRLGGFQMAASSRVQQGASFPDPSASLPYEFHLSDTRVSLGDQPASPHLELALFDLQEVQLLMADELSLSFDAGESRPLEVTVDSDFSSPLFSAENAQSIQLDVAVDSVPEALTLNTDFQGRVSYTAEEVIDSISVEALLDDQDEGGLLNLSILSGRVDLNRDGLVDAADDGFYDAIELIDGRLDVDQSGDINSDDDATFENFHVVNGELDLNRDEVIDASDSSPANGTRIGFHLNDLPAELEFQFHPGTLPVREGRLDLNGDGTIDDQDTGRFAGSAVIEGQIDINGDGFYNSFDDGTAVTHAVEGGLIDLDADGEVDSADTGSIGGMDLRMSGPIGEFFVQAKALGNTPQLFNSGEGENRLMRLNASDLPARWTVTFAEKTESNGEEIPPDLTTRILFETLDAAGDPQPFGQIEALIANTTDAFQLAHQFDAFQQQQVQTAGGPILDGTTPQRFHYSPFTQEIDHRYLEDSNVDAATERLDAIFARGVLLDPASEHVVIRNRGETLQLLSARISGMQRISADIFTSGEDGMKATADVELQAPTSGLHPLYVGIGNSDAIINDQDDGVYRGFRVIDGQLDLSGDGEISSADSDGVAGLPVIDGRFDLNVDGEVDEDDDGFLEGLRVIDGQLDIGELLQTLDIENVPDQLIAELALDQGRIRFETNDDTSDSVGRVDVYSGPMPFADDDDLAARIIVDRVPQSLNIDWSGELPISLETDADEEVNFVPPKLELDASEEVHIAGIIQQPVLGEATNRIVFDLQAEDLQLGYELDLFRFDVLDSVELTLGQEIIDGFIDADGDGDIDDDDDGSFGGFFGIGAVTIINGRLDMDGDGDVDDDPDDDGTTGGFTVIDGRVDVNQDGSIDEADDFDNTVAEIPIQWEVFRAAAGIDNDVSDPDIGANLNKPAINGLLQFYQRVEDPQELTPDGPLPRSSEYVPLVSLVLDDFRELSATVDVTLGLDSQSLLPLPLSVDAGIQLSGSIVFDLWSPLDVTQTLDINFPDWLPLDDLTLGIQNLVDYVDNTPLHLFPVTGVFAVPIEEGSLVFHLLGLHEFSDHEDPFD